jgi:hypothetical protein
MGPVRRVIGSILVAAFGASSSSCLLDRQILEDGYVTPLSAPVIVEQRSVGTMDVTNPLPGEIIVAPTPTGGAGFPVEFTVTIRFPFAVPLLARAWTDRNLENCIARDTGGTCGADIRLAALPPPEAGIDRRFKFRVDFNTELRCTRVDLYVAHRFQNDDNSVRHLPERPGEVAHARWLVIVPSRTGQLPPPDECRDRVPSTSG